MFSNFVKGFFEYDGLELKSFDKLFPIVTYNLIISCVHPRYKFKRLRQFMIVLQIFVNAYFVYLFGTGACMSINRQDWTNAIRVMSVTTAAIIGQVKIFTFIICDKKIKESMEKVEEDIMNIDKLPEEEQKILKSGIKTIQLANYLVEITLAPSVTVFYIVLIFRMIVSQITDHAPQRFMIFAYEILFFEGRELDTPFYEIHFIIELLYSVFSMCTIIGFTALLTIFYIHLIYQLKIVCHKIVNIYDKIDSKDHKTANRRLNEAIELHQTTLKFSDTLQSVFGIYWTTIIQLATIFLCMTGYQITNLDVFIENPEVIALLMAGFCKILLLCILGESLANNSIAVAEAMYFCGWEKCTDRLMARKMKYVIMKSQKPACVIVFGFVKVDMQLLSKILNTAYVYMTLINSSQEDK